MSVLSTNYLQIKTSFFSFVLLFFALYVEVSIFILIKVLRDEKNNNIRSLFLMFFRIKKDEYQSNAGELVIYSLDLSSLKSVKDCARNLLMKETAIHILVNNAGIAFHPYEKTEDGNEMTFQTNHLSHFLLTLLLLPKMQSSSPGCRIVNVSSFIHICM